MPHHGETAGRLRHVLPRHRRRNHEFKSRKANLKALSIIKHQLSPFCQALHFKNTPIFRAITFREINTEQNQVDRILKRPKAFRSFYAPCQTRPNAAIWNLITLLIMTAMSLFLKRYRLALACKRHRCGEIGRKNEPQGVFAACRPVADHGQPRAERISRG